MLDNYMNTNLTQATLKELFEYNPETGNFIRLVARGGIASGTVAGCKTSGGYIQIRVNGIDYKASRLAVLYMTGEFPENIIDHKNRICHDNRWDSVCARKSWEAKNNIKIF